MSADTVSVKASAADPSASLATIIRAANLPVIELTNEQLAELGLKPNVKPNVKPPAPKEPRKNARKTKALGPTPTIESPMVPQRSRPLHAVPPQLKTGRQSSDAPWPSPASEPSAALKRVRGGARANRDKPDASAQTETAGAGQPVRRATTLAGRKDDADIVLASNGLCCICKDSFALKTGVCRSCAAKEVFKTKISGDRVAAQILAGCDSFLCQKRGGFFLVTVAGQGQVNCVRLRPYPLLGADDTLVQEWAYAGGEWSRVDVKDQTE